MTEAETEAERIARVEARYQARHENEDLQLRMQVAPMAVVPLALCLVLLYPLVTIAFGSLDWKLLFILVLDFPILIYAGTIWWCQRIRLSRGRVYEGPQVRTAAGLIIAASLGLWWLVIWFQ